MKQECFSKNKPLALFLFLVARLLV